MRKGRLACRAPPRRACRDRGRRHLATRSSGVRVDRYALEVPAVQQPRRRHARNPRSGVCRVRASTPPLLVNPSLIPKRRIGMRILLPGAGYPRPSAPSPREGTGHEPQRGRPRRSRTWRRRGRGCGAPAGGMFYRTPIWRTTQCPASANVTAYGAHEQLPWAIPRASNISSECAS